MADTTDEPPVPSSVDATKSDPSSDVVVEDDITETSKAISSMTVDALPEPPSIVQEEVSPATDDQQQIEESTAPQQPPVVQQLPLNLPQNFGPMEALDDADAAAAYDNEFLSLLPPCILPRITKLKSLNDARDAILEEYRLERAALEMKFMKRMETLFDERRGVINGEFDTVIDTDNTVQDKNEDDNNNGEESAEVVKAEGVVEDVSDDGDGEDVQNEQLQPRDAVKGIPQFWACAMGHVDVIAELITEGERIAQKCVAVYRVLYPSVYFFAHILYLQKMTNLEPLPYFIADVDCLDHLTDVACTNFSDGTGFELHFHFSPNPFFANKILTKRYEVPNLLTEDEPILKNVTGTTINWKDKQSLTYKEVTKKQRKKNGANAGQIRTITKKERTESFFHFFTPPSMPGLMEVMDEDEADAVEEAFDHDYDVAQAIRGHLIPKAVLWFTGEAMIEDYDEEMMEEMVMQDMQAGGAGQPFAFNAEGDVGSNPFPQPQPGEGQNPECKQN